jgi:hypothetical protein
MTTSETTERTTNLLRLAFPEARAAVVDAWEDAIAALASRPITELDVEIFDAAWLLDISISREDAEETAARLREMARDGWDPRVLQFAANLAMRSTGRHSDMEAFPAKLRAALEEPGPEAA